jgi:aspartate racemase
MSLTLGLLGGVSPAATLSFLAKLQAFTPARSDQDHIRVIADINPAVGDTPVPGVGGAPGPMLAEMAGALRGAGADVLAIASNGAHAHADLIQRASRLPLIDMIGTAAAGARASGVRRVGVLGAKASLRLYREYLAAQAMGMVTLSAEGQGELLALLREVRGGEAGAQAEAKAATLAAELIAEGAELVICGSVSLSLLLRPEDIRVELIEPLELLARRCVAVCLGSEPAPQAPAG